MMDDRGQAIQRCLIMSDPETSPDIVGCQANLLAGPWPAVQGSPACGLNDFRVGQAGRSMTRDESQARISRMAPLIRELRRRRVFRTAALYVIGAWVAMQVADVLFPGFGIPDEAIRVLVWTAALGFPFALAFGWFFDIGRGGLHRTPPLGSEGARDPRPLNRIDFTILAAFVLVAGALVYNATEQVLDVPAEPAQDPPQAQPGMTASKLPNSIAVLPFANISNDPDNEYFCDGVSEEILNKLSEMRPLNVIGRTSSFAFKGSNTGIERISAILGVGHVLQGSVRKAGSQLRISAQLLDERGRQLWTQTFDRELENVFEIQAEIAQAVATRVAEQVIASPERARHPNLEAYDHYLAGRELLHRRDMFRAMTALERAIELDPDFAEAHAEWAIARSMGLPSRQNLESADAAINRALALQPRLLRAQAARALWLLQSIPPDPAAAEATLRSVLGQEPNMTDALLWLSNALGAQGREDEAIEILSRANRIDPLHPSIAVNLADALRMRGEGEAARLVVERVLQQPNPGFSAFVSVARMHERRGELIELNAVAKDSALRAGKLHYLLALSYALLGDLDSAEYWIERSLRDYPEWFHNPYFPATIRSWKGDAEHARQRFEQGMKAAGLEPADLSEETRIWHGSLLARSGHHAAAIELLEPMAHLATTPESLNVDWLPEHEGWHALAWSYRHTGAEARAAEILSDVQGQCRLRLEPERGSVDSDLLYYCAENALMAGDTDDALSLLGRAVAGGWRDYYVRQNDPYWMSLADDPRYRALMATVKADIARQRAEVERIDATDDFMARLDAALAARRSSSQ
jgi:TolB-like protein